MSTAFRFGSDSRDKSPRQFGSWRMSGARWRRAHVVAATLASVIILPVGYIAYCMATLPDNGGLVIEPTPSALIVEATDGEVFASRGVFKGDKLSAQSSPSRTGTFTSTAGSICPPFYGRWFATFARAVRAKAEARSPSSSHA
jgi:hypothetical protein